MWRPGYPALMLFRALLLGQLYRLSDLQLANQLMRDLLFRRFCRIELDQSVPDAVTLGRFRAALDGRMDDLLALVNRALAAQHLILTEGQIAIVDATVVEAAQSGFKTRDPEGGSSALRGTKGMVTAVWGWKGLLAWMRIISPARWILPPAMLAARALGSSIWSTSCWAMRSGFMPMQPISGRQRKRFAPHRDHRRGANATFTDRGCLVYPSI
jgi:IS5 family transposase